jgi:hypothetical protein
MPSNNTSGIVHYFAGAYPGKVGLLISPDGWRVPPWYMPYALDNGAFGAFMSTSPWNEKAYYQMLSRANFCHRPMWVIVPDVVADADATLKSWHRHKDRVFTLGYKLAFAVQDGMEPNDVPQEAHCCFVGGSTEWKLASAHKFKGVCEWLHIGRVNTPDRLGWAKSIGADSVDGTGFFRGNNYQTRAFIEHFVGRQERLFL